MRGDKFDYCVQVPSRDWYLRPAAAARKTNPLSDRWLMRPDYGAHVMIIGEQVKEGRSSGAPLSTTPARPEHFARMREEMSGIVRSFRARCATSR
jgi:hypothetical protein